MLDNTLTDNGGGAVVVGPTESGAAVGLPSHDNLVQGNTIEEAGGPAIEVSGTQAAPALRNRVIDNVAHRSNGEGIHLYHARESLLRGNDVRSNKSGIVLNNASENTLEYNDASESEGTGIEISDLSVTNRLIRNTSSHNDGTGIEVADEVGSGSGTVIERNSANNNKTYGIHVPKVSHTITGNTANDNGTWGIWASEGSNGRTNIDGGGNKAQGNLGPLDPLTLKPLQCFSVRCDGGPGTSDLDPPSTVLLDGPPATTRNDVASFRFNGHDNSSTLAFQCRFDPVDPAQTNTIDWEDCESPHHTILDVGEHLFQVRAVDASGNPDPTPASHQWEILAPLPFRPPITTIHSGPDHSTVETIARFEFSSDERLSDFDCNFDGAGFAPCTWTTFDPLFARGTFTRIGLLPGVHEFQVQARDRDIPPNVGSPAVWRWVVQSPPTPAEVSCGEILVESVQATNDLIDCPGHGLIVGKSGITVDLDGHVIDGLGLEAGILNHGFDNVTITNGTISEFDYGVQLNPGTGRNVISSMEVLHNQEGGIALADADQAGNGNTLRGNTITFNKIGIALYSGTKDTDVRENHLAANDAEGVYIEHASANRVERNEIAGGGGGVTMLGGSDNAVVENTMSHNLGPGVIVGEELLPSNNAVIERNLIEGAGGGGISIIESSDVRVVENVVRDSGGPGVTTELAKRAQIRANDVRGNQGGIAVEESEDTTIELNNASGGLGTGIEVGVLSPGTDILHNIANENGGEGIAVEDSATVQGRGVQLLDNQADSNGGDGIALEGVGHVVEKNSARMNGGWGIYAAVGAVNRGGNTAGGNAEPDQCYGVVCNQAPVPGAPETEIVSFQGHAKPLPTSTGSRNASFTYIGSDRESPLHEIVYECRLDSPELDGLGGLRLPGGVPEPGARPAHGRGPRHRHERLRSGGPDPGKAHVDLPAAAAERRARGHPRHQAQEPDLAARRPVHLPLERAGRHLRVQGGLEPV